MFKNRFFYLIKPFLPRGLQLFLRRLIVRRKIKLYSNVWPISKSSSKPPANWEGWPKRKKFALVLTHDVEFREGHDKCTTLMNLEKKLGFVSSFNFVPERYKVDSKLREILVGNGFEVGVHGLYHDGKLFQSKSIFLKRAKKINCYLKKWQAVGFRAPSMHHNLEWIRELDLEYDLSTFDTDPFEPQSDGVNTIFPFWVNGDGHNKGYVELPYTLVQDFTLLILMKQRDIELWKRKLDWIADNNGMALLNVHPDYINFENKFTTQEFPLLLYEELLNYINDRYEDQYWHALPKEVARFVRTKCLQ
jgi:hypothetical protein